MRPGDFSPGNLRRRRGRRLAGRASMRPGDFSPGNLPASRGYYVANCGFNEAGGFLPRKRRSRRAAMPLPS